MNITFIEPKSRFNAYNYGNFNKLFMLGPLYMGTILKNKGHNVEIYKENLKKPDYDKLNTDVLGITVLTPQSQEAYKIAKNYKQKNPKCKIIMGGPHVSALPHEAEKYADHIVIGEAEPVISDLVEGNIKEKIVRCNQLTDINKLPFPDTSLIKGLRSVEFLPVSTSRGCPFNCKFCSVTSMFGKKYRWRDTKQIIKELQNTKSKRIFFHDDNFCANQNRTLELLQSMKDAGETKREWVCQTRIDITNNDKLLNLMKETNCEKIFFGFESINSKTLKSFQKSQTLEQIKNCIKKIKDYGINIWGSFILGSDTDDKNTIKNTIDFCNENEIELPQFNILTPFPGTKIYEELNKQKRIFNKNWDYYDAAHVVFKPRKLTSYDLQKGIMDAFSELYSLKTKRLKKMLFEYLTNIKSLLKFEVIEIKKVISNLKKEQSSYLNKLKNLSF